MPRFLFLALLLSSTQAHAYTRRQCESMRLDRAMCESQIRDGSRDPSRPCPPVPRECYGNGGGDIDGCTSQRLDYAMCLNNARSAGLPDSVCGEEPTCGR